MRLRGKSVIVIGAGRGIGVGIAEVFAREGARLLLVGRDIARTEALAERLRTNGAEAAAVAGNLNSTDQMTLMAAEAVKLYGRIDVLVQNGGIYPQVSFDNMTHEQWREVLGNNLDGTFNAIQAVLPAMKDQRYGRIVLTSSISGPRVGWPGGAHYTASKAGINGMMRTAAVELAKHNITINAVEPGNILSDGLEEIGEEWMEGMRKAIPLGRLGTAEEVAHAHLFLASDESAYITGQSIIVDGGQVLPESPFNDY